MENCCVNERGPWKVFAKLGHIFGLVSLIGVLVPFVSAALAVDGIILSALGKKSTVNRDKAKKGLTMNIIACAVNFVVSVVVSVIFLINL
jgi:hypothetical protein